jgi:hypothetical protein
MIDLTSNRISHVMSAEALQQTKQDLQDLSSNLNFMVSLSQEEVDALYKVSDADKTFIRNCIADMPTAEAFLPPYFKAEEVRKDMNCGEQLLELENALLELYTNVRRNRMLANAEAYAGASVFYRLTQAAGRAGNPSAQSVYERMLQYHQGQKRGKRTVEKKG